MTDFTHHTPKVLTDADAAADLAGLPRPSMTEGLPSTVSNLAFQLLAAANYIEALGGDSRSYRAAVQAAQPEAVGERCPLCNYQHGHMIGCKRNPVDIALASAPAEPMSATTARHCEYNSGTCNRRGCVGQCQALCLMQSATPPSAATEPSDAERLDWLLSRIYVDPEQLILRIKDVVVLDGNGTLAEKIAAAIDAAIRATKGGKL